MCGIWGAVAIGAGNVPDRSTAIHCTRLLEHRGPDSTGVEHGGSWTLGHTRLSIVDLTDRGRQPMRSQDGRYTIVFNGEIFNHRELHRRLDLPPGPTCDTATLVAGWAKLGPDLLPLLEGFFAFAIYDSVTRALTLARDRHGIKPLYYAQADGMVCFSSEIKALRPVLGVLRPDMLAVTQFLSLRHVLAPRTLYAGVLQLAPQSYLTVSDGGSELVKWRCEDVRIRRRSGSRRAASDVRDSVAEACETWSRGDVPLAAYLSGGLDSTALAYELNRLRPGLTCFVADYGGSADSEVDVAVRTAADLGLELRVVPAVAAIDPDRLRTLIELKDGPLAMHNEIAMVQLSEAVSKDFKVVVSGEGADELFAGYGRAFRAALEFKRKGWDAVSGRGTWRRWVSAPSFGKFLEQYSYIPLDAKHGLYRAEMAELIDGDRELVELMQEAWLSEGDSNSHRSITSLFLQVHLPGLLQVLDWTGMAHGVECRVPFLHQRVVSTALALPESYKLRWRSPWARLRSRTETPNVYSERRDVTKACLRVAYRRSLPKPVLTAAKRPFPAPLREWLQSPQGAWVEEALMDREALLFEIFDRDRLCNWWRTEADGDRTFSRQVWILLNLELWMRTNFTREQVRSALGSGAGNVQKGGSRVANSV